MATRSARLPASSPRRTTWRHVWLAGLGAVSASTRTARDAVQDARTGVRDGVLRVRDAAGTAVERLDVAQRRVERRLRALRPGARR